MHIDLNSCFAIIEQQANRLLRGRPVGVAAYDTPRGFVVAASYEAKAKGIKLGVNVQESRALCPGIVILTPDPPKYREAHKRFKELLLEYTPHVVPKSIDEFVLDMRASPALRNRLNAGMSHNDAMQDIGNSMKRLIAERLGEWVTVNVGIGTNRFLAKYAAGFGKPNGMTLIDHTNLRDYYQHSTPQTCASLRATVSNGTNRIDAYGEVSSATSQARNSQEDRRVSASDGKQADRCEVCGGMVLVDLPGINTRYRSRLRAAGIYTPLEFLDADMTVLKKQVFKSINGYHWYMRLRGYEADSVEFSRKSIGHQHALSDKTTDMEKLERLLMKLSEKTGRRLRKNNFYAQGIHLYIGFVSDEPWSDDPVGFEHMHKMRKWSHGEKVAHRLYATSDIYEAAKRLLHNAEIDSRVRAMSVHVFDLHEWDPEQLSLFDQQDTTLHAPEHTFRSVNARKKVSDSIDAINNRYGEFVVTPATMMDMSGTILDRVAFGQVKDID